MKIVEMKTDEIEESTYNPRIPLEPGTPQWENLERSLDEFGTVEPLIWNETTKRLVGGHQRLRILRHKGEKKAWVSVVELDENREKALNLALNNPSLQSTWDAPALIKMVESMDSELVHLAGFESADETHELLRMAEIQTETSFLDAALSGNAEREEQALASRAREIDLKEEHSDRTGPQMFEVTLLLTGEQRAIYFQAIERAKKSFDTQNSFEAVIELCNRFNKEWERDHADAGVGPD